MKISVEKAYSIFRKAAETDKNVAVYGRHGGGKTYISKQVMEDLGINYAYFSCSTMDPWADMVGIPLPDRETHTLDFIRPSKMEEAEAIILDEFNRAPAKVMNAVMEMIQFKSINGKPLPKLRMVWCLFNPPEKGYHVLNLDVATMDRFQLHFEMMPEPSVGYMVEHEGISLETAGCLVDWWNKLSVEQRQVCSARRLSYMGQLWDEGFDIEATVPYGVKLPVDSLLQHLRRKSDFLTLQDLETKEKEIIKRLESGDSNCEDQIADILSKATFVRIVQHTNIIKAMSKDRRRQFFAGDVGVKVRRYLNTPDVVTEENTRNLPMLPIFIEIIKEAGVYEHVKDKSTAKGKKK